MDYHIFIAVFGFIIVDFLTGLCGGVMNKSFSSQKMREGLIHKLSYVLAIATGLLGDWATQFADISLPFDNGITLLVITWIIITEIGSILENLCVINPEFDNEFMRIFKKD